MNYRDDVPLTEHDFAAIRGEVLQRVSRRRSSFAWIWAVAAIAIIVSLRLFVSPFGTPASSPAGRRASRPPSPQTAAAPRVETAAPHVQRQPPSADTAPQHVAAARRPRHHHEQPRLARPHAIELVTANPDIRIIWITDRRNS